MKLACLGNKRKTHSACLRNKRKKQDAGKIACLRYKRKKRTEKQGKRGEYVCEIKGKKQNKENIIYTQNEQLDKVLPAARFFLETLFILPLPISPGFSAGLHPDSFQEKHNRQSAAARQQSGIR